MRSSLWSAQLDPVRVQGLGAQGGELRASRGTELIEDRWVRKDYCDRVTAGDWQSGGGDRKRPEVYRSSRLNLRLLHNCVPSPGLTHTSALTSAWDRWGAVQMHKTLDMHVLPAAKPCAGPDADPQLLKVPDLEEPGAGPAVPGWGLGPSAAAPFRVGTCQHS